MDRMTENLLFIRGLQAHTDRLESLLGSRWDDFQRQWWEYWQKLLKAEDDTTFNLIMDACYEIMAKSEQSPDIASLSFEDALKELEDIVRQLETGKSSLEDAIGAYERGARLKRHCETKLTEARARVEALCDQALAYPWPEPGEGGYAVKQFFVLTPGTL